MKASLRLFKALPITGNGKKKPVSNSLVKETIKNGFIFSPEVLSNYSETQLKGFIPEIKKVIGLSGLEMNNAFHKSWKKVHDADIEDLVLEQIIHYITTYGFESLGIYHEDSVYVPTEKLSIPKIDTDKIPLVIIRGYTEKEIKEKVLNMLRSGIALAETTMSDIVKVLLEEISIPVEEEEISSIKNKEVKIFMYDSLGKVPKNPIEFLRFLVYKTTGKTLLIKDKDTIKSIKDKNTGVVGEVNRSLLKQYSETYGLESLSSIFYRFKPLFLAFRTSDEHKRVINRIRRLAVDNHKPMEADFLNDVTKHIKQGTFNTSGLNNILRDELKKVNTFRKIRLAYALRFRESSPESVVYRIRNGKTYVTDFDKQTSHYYSNPIKTVLKSISKDMEKKVKGKKIYIPEGIVYALPSTEKQFVGNFPFGTCVSLPKDMIFGVHWENLSSGIGNRVDLDLSLIDSEGYKLGWDGRYRNLEGSILFSGDLTSAPKPNGASELFYVEKNSNIKALLLLNYFNFEEGLKVPFKIMVSAKKPSTKFSSKCMVNPNDVISVDNAEISVRQKMIGLLVVNKDICKFYYVESNIAGTITSIDSDIVRKSRQFLFDYYTNSISLNEMLQKAGAELVSSKEESDIDLSPESLEKDTIINLLS